jgi:hypothetical protein
MHQHHSPALTRFLTSIPSRRDILRGLAGAGLGLGSLGLQNAGEAKKKGKRKPKKKPKKPKPNAFGCLDVGKPCGGDDGNCCSGICEGVKPKKGKKDKSRCIGHNAGICKVDFDLCSTGSFHLCSSTNPLCACLLTTGNAAFCADASLGLTQLCRDCRQDADCQEEFGPGAACLVTGGVCESSCPDTGTACMPPCA